MCDCIALPWAILEPPYALWLLPFSERLVLLTGVPTRMPSSFDAIALDMASSLAPLDDHIAGGIR